MGKKRRQDPRFSDDVRLYITDEAKPIIRAIRKKFYDKRKRKKRGGEG